MVISLHQKIGTSGTSLLWNNVTDTYGSFFLLEISPVNNVCNVVNTNGFVPG